MVRKMARRIQFSNNEISVVCKINVKSDFVAFRIALIELQRGIYDMHSCGDMC